MKKGLGKKLDMLLSLVIIVVLLPLFITIICQRMELEKIIYGEVRESGESVEAGTEVESDREEDTEDGLAGEVSEEQIVGIVAKEIGANANREAILAQCVIARTNLYDARKRHTTEPEALSIGEMQELWGADFDQIYQEMEECAALTGDEVLVWNGDYIYAAYHALSAGRTRNVTEMYEAADMPYLTEKACQEDVTAEGYLSVSYWEREEFLTECRKRFPEAALSDISEIQVLSRDETGYVKEIQVGSGTFLGEEFRSRWELNSACFTITEMEDKVRIVTKGLGHGFGLSQNTANLMAAEGKSYEEILAYFYPGTELRAASSLK